VQQHPKPHLLVLLLLLLLLLTLQGQCCVSTHMCITHALNTHNFVVLPTQALPAGAAAPADAALMLLRATPRASLYRLISLSC
jgi:hypothetical protein